MRLQASTKIAKAVIDNAQNTHGALQDSVNNDLAKQIGQTLVNNLDVSIVPSSYPKGVDGEPKPEAEGVEFSLDLHVISHTNYTKLEAKIQQMWTAGRLTAQELKDLNEYIK